MALQRIREIFQSTGLMIAIVIMLGVLGLQVLLLYGAVESRDLNSVVVSLAGVYVAVMLLIGYSTNRLQSKTFLTVLFVGWSILFAASYLVDSSTIFAVLAVFTGIVAVYYALQFLDRGNFLSPLG